MNLALHCRFLEEGSAWLGTNHGRETCVIEVATAVGTPYWEEFYHEIEDIWFSVDGARPHWGKIYNTGAELKDRYQRMDDFLATRERWDPDRVFLNPFLEKEVFQI